ncbi:MAG: IS3 family transposase [Planctomycetota bacterium]
MARRRYSAEEIVNKLREAEVLIAGGKTVAEASKQLGVTDQTYYKWRREYGGLKTDQAKRFKDLERENARLKKLVAELSLDKAMLQDVAPGKLLSPRKTREAVHAVRARYRVSERRACSVLRQHRSTQRYAPIERDDEKPLTRRIIELAAAFGRYGYRRIAALLNHEGWGVNHKRVERIWRQEGLKVPKKQRKRGRLWLNDGSCVRRRAERKDHVWAFDFVHDRTKDGRAIRLLVIVDEFTRECLSIDVARKLSSDDVLERLAWLMATRGVPECIRSDNGPECIATALRAWLGRIGVETLYIEPGSPWENGYVESFNSKLRDELLARERFDTLNEAKVLIERWRRHYNTERPHSSLDYRPPAPEAVAIRPLGRAAEPCSAALRTPQQQENASRLHCL